MIESLRRNPVLALLALVCAVLAGVVAFELLMPGAASTAGAPRKSAPAEAKLLPPVATASADQVYTETVNRPLWIPTRRPAPAVATTPAASFQKGQYTLQGVIVAGGTRIAMLREKTSGRVHRVEKGRDLNGIQVAEIEPEAVTLAQGDDREVIELRVTRPGAPGTPAAAPPTAAATAGPFAPPRSQPAPVAAAPVPGVAPTAQNPVAAPPAGNPFGVPPRPPQAAQTSAGPLPAGPPGTNPSGPQVPQQATTAPMTPEELLARRRARRNQSP